jgi:hypothetical protein
LNILKLTLKKLVNTVVSTELEVKARDSPLRDNAETQPSKGTRRKRKP